MGCSSSKSAAFETAMNKLEFKRVVKELEVLQLSISDVRKLYYVFDDMVSDGMESISLAELLAHCDLQRTAFTEKVFGIFSSNQSVEIDFRAFVYCVWNFCTLNRVILDMFMFDLYDKDGRQLAPSDVGIMLEEMFGKADFKTDVHAKSVSADLQTYEERKKTFTMDKFHTFMMKHQPVLFPAFQMQLAVQTKVIGTSYWQRQTEHRVKLSKLISEDTYVSIAKLVDKTKHSIHLDAPPARGGNNNNGDNTAASSGTKSRSSSIVDTTSGKKKRGSKIYVDVDAPSSGPGTGASTGGSMSSGVILFEGTMASSKYGSTKGSGANLSTKLAVMESMKHSPEPPHLGEVPQQGSGPKRMSQIAHKGSTGSFGVSGKHTSAKH